MPNPFEILIAILDSGTSLSPLSIFTILPLFLTSAQNSITPWLNFVASSPSELQSVNYTHGHCGQCFRKFLDILYTFDLIQHILSKPTTCAIYAISRQLDLSTTLILSIMMYSFLRHLEHWFNISGSALNWLSSYHAPFYSISPYQSIRVCFLLTSHR